MKRLVLVAALLLAVTAPARAALTLGDLEAVKWVNQNASNINQPMSNSATRDTLYKQIKVGTTDTTNWVSTVGWKIPDSQPSDSLALGVLWVTTDSTAAGSFTATSFTITPQYKIGPVGDTQIFSGAAITLTDVTANDLGFKIPIYIVGNTTRGLINATSWPPPAVRYLIVAIGGVVSPARLYLQHLFP